MLRDLSTEHFHAGVREGLTFHRQNRRTNLIVDAHCDGKCFVVRADEKLSAFAEQQSAIQKFAMDLISLSAFSFS